MRSVALLTSWPTPPQQLDTMPLSFIFAQGMARGLMVLQLQQTTFKCKHSELALI